MLHRIRHVHEVSIDARGDQGFVENVARRSDERLAGAILLVSGLFADEHDRGAPGAGAEYGLRAGFPKVTRAAGLRRFFDAAKRTLVRGLWITR